MKLHGEGLKELEILGFGPVDAIFWIKCSRCCKYYAENPEGREAFEHFEAEIDQQHVEMLSEPAQCQDYSPEPVTPSTVKSQKTVLGLNTVAPKPVTPLARPRRRRADGEVAFINTSSLAPASTVHLRTPTKDQDTDDVIVLENPLSPGPIVSTFTSSRKRKVREAITLESSPPTPTSLVSPGTPQRKRKANQVIVLDSPSPSSSPRSATASPAPHSKRLAKEVIVID